MKVVNKPLMGIAAAFLAFAAPAGATTYVVDQQFAVGGVTGFIETTGARGALRFSDIVDWQLTLTDRSATVNLNGPQFSAVQIEGRALTATSSELRFDFDAGGGFALFQGPALGSARNFWCIDNGGCNNFAVPGQSVRTSNATGQVGQTFSGLYTFASVAPPEPPAVEPPPAAAVPLPAGLPLLATALFGLGALRRARRTASGR